jgi:16S rRNA (cytosine967-C5)-methyltransferase
VAQLSARGAALAALRLWRTGKQFADAIISRVLAESGLSRSDRAFALELFYGVLRNLTLLDFWIGCLRTARLSASLRDIIRLGLYQILLLKIPEHAAVYESVELAPRKNRGLINSLLRAAVRQQDRLQAQASKQSLSIQTSHPQFLIGRWEKNFGRKNTAALCAWNNRPPPLYARINRLKVEQEEFVRAYPKTRPLESCPGFVEFSSFPTEALERGHCYVQDPSGAIACHMIDPQPGERILDACAAPGGKTSYLAELMDNRGTIVACDRAPERVRVLKDNMERLGVEIACVFCFDWRRNCIPQEIASYGPFDRILIDAPCSNTGVMRRRVDVKWRLRANEFARMQGRQLEIVRAVAPLLKSDGVFVYSTCSLEPEENEQVVGQLLAEFPGLRLEQEKNSLPFRDKFDGAFAAKIVGID